VPSVFISSVWRSDALGDLNPLRRRLREFAYHEKWSAWLDVVNAPDLDVVADPLSVRLRCLAEVENQDLYVGILTDRYGGARYDAADVLSRAIGISLTELELHRAISCGRAVRLYVVSLGAGHHREDELEALLSSLHDDGLLRNSNVCRTTLRQLPDQFVGDIRRADWRAAFSVDPGSFADGFRPRLTKIPEFLHGLLHDTGGAVARHFDRDRLESNLRDMRGNYAKGSYSRVLSLATRSLAELRAFPPARTRVQLDLWVGVTELLNKSSNWLGVGIGDLAAAMLLKRLLYLSGRPRDLIEHYLWDGGVATCLRNMALARNGTLVRPDLMQQGLLRTARALIHANSPETAQRKAGLEDIRATILKYLGRDREAVGAARRAVAIRDADGVSPEDSWGYSLGTLGWCRGARRDLDEGLEVCRHAGHAGFVRQLLVWLADVELKRANLDGAGRNLAEALVLERHLLGGRASTTSVPKELELWMEANACRVTCERVGRRIEFEWSR